MSEVMIRRHSLWTRVTHWVNALAFTLMLMSGLQIFNAHPALYWGAYSDFGSPWLALAGFPSWATLPSYNDLATGRRWHFFFAWLLVGNGALYWLAGLARRHLPGDLVPTRAQLAAIGPSIAHHLRLHFPREREYNVLQKLSYLGVVALLLPLMLLSGLAMSPGVDSAAPLLPELFGGRQSARSVHFICASLLVLFVVVHLLMVLVSGVGNNLRSMVTGRYSLRESR
jgi:thiosulfate reductase cytochrome b subunit